MHTQPLRTSTTDNEPTPTTFMEALKRKDYTSFRELLSNSTPTEFDEEGNSVFATAVIRGELTPIQWLIDHYKHNMEAMSAQLHSANHHGLNALYQAARHGHNYTTDKLVTLGSDPTIGCDDDGMTTPLWILENYSRSSIIKSHDSQDAADESNENHSPKTPRVKKSKVDAIKSQQAALKHVKRVLLMSLQRGIDPNQCRKSDGKSLLHMATEADAVEVVWILLAYGADRHATMKGNISAYALAKSERMRHILTLSDEDIASCSTTASSATMYELSMTYSVGHNEAMRNLIHGRLPAHLQKNIDDLINDGLTAAARKQHDDAATDEISADITGTDVPLSKYSACTTAPSTAYLALPPLPLTAAVVSGNEREVIDLIRAGHAVTTCNSYDNSLLMLSSHYGWLSITQLILANQSVTKDHINQMNRYGCTALTLAIMRQHTSIVCTLLDAGAKPNIGHGVDGKPALLRAAEQGDVSMVCKLLKKYAHVHATDSWGMSALMVAAEKSQSASDSYCKIAEELLHNGARVAQTNRHGKSAIALAKHPFMRWLLQDAQSNPSTGRDINSKQALLRATSQGNHSVACILIDRGANIHGTNHWGMTPLMIAAQNSTKPHDGYWRIAMRLLKAGAAVHYANPNGNTALTLAKHDAMRWELQSAGSQQYAQWHPPQPVVYRGGFYPHGGFRY